jgi:hypothetical protein
MLIFPLGIKATLLELALTFKDVLAVSTSETEKVIAPVLESSLIVRLVISEIAGASFTPLIVITNEVDVDKEPSEATNVTIALPDIFEAGVAVIVRAVPLPPKTSPAGGIRPVLLDEADTVNAPPLSISFTENDIAPVDESSLTVLAGIEETVGPSFTAFTVTVKLTEADFAPSETLRVIVVEPLAFALGVNASVRFQSLPLKTNPALENNPLLLDEAETVSRDN